MNRLFCSICKRKTNHCDSYHCLEHDGWKEIDAMKRINDSLRKELNDWKERWAMAHNRGIKLTEFYGKPESWTSDEYDTIVAIVDAGELARNLATLESTENDFNESRSREVQSSMAKDL